jgi:hypothetical protein
MSLHDTIRQVLKPLSSVEDGDLAYSLRAGRIDTAWVAFSFDPTLAGPRGEAAPLAGRLAGPETGLPSPALPG